jgi:xenotropic and polytropic retrovirus receptor 1
MFAFFVFCATLNSAYTSLWDLVMDWSLLDPTAKKPFLRDMLAYKQTWLYYLAIFIDPVLRFNWIFYAIYARELQHSALLSFLVALSEVCRRGLWMLFRVENEHCTNVVRFRASRDIPLPFETTDYTPAALESGVLSPSREDPLSGHVSAPQVLQHSPSPADASLAPIATGSDRTTHRSPSLRFRKAESPLARTLSVVGAAMHEAHAQDFVRRKKDAVMNVVEPDSSDDEAEENVGRASNIEEWDEEEDGGREERRRSEENGNGIGYGKGSDKRTGKDPI